jgi:HSP20 family protein
MWNIEPLKAGQEVFLRRPEQIYAKVIGPLECDLGLPEEQVRYAVQLLPLEQYYLAQDLELANWPRPEISRPADANPEPVEDLADFSETGPNLPAGNPFLDLAEEIESLIASRAYQLYEQRGFVHGHDAEDWLQAESEILLNVAADATETATQLAISAQVPGFSENDLEVRVAPRSVCITGARQGRSESTEEFGHSGRRANRIFRVLDLPSEIDPVRVTASLGDGILEVKLLKVGVRNVVPVRAKSASA